MKRYLAAGSLFDFRCPNTCRSRKKPVNVRPSIISVGEPETPFSKMNFGSFSNDSLYGSPASFDTAQPDFGET